MDLGLSPKMALQGGQAMTYLHYHPPENLQLEMLWIEPGIFCMTDMHCTMEQWPLPCKLAAAAEEEHFGPCPLTTPTTP